MNSGVAASAAAAQFRPDLARRRLTGTVFLGLCLLSIFILLLALVLLLFDVLREGLPWLSWDFITGVPSRRPKQAGILPALVGSIQITIMVGLIAFPVGVAAAIYLQEYARDSFVNRLLKTNISNLAGVPSIIYGIFGLALFVRVLGFGYTLFSAALTLVLLILPVIILASVEALRAVPDSQREGAYALGASRWQMVRGAVLPGAAPGLMTGIILAMARAIGETAPLILVGAVTFVTFLPQPFEGGYTVLPIQVFQWIGAATIIVILVLMLILNALALIVRVRLSRNIQW